MGGRICSIVCADKNGVFGDVAQCPKDYTQGNPYYGAIIGRVANRIREGKFTLQDIDYTLSINNAPNHLHGGPHGFHNQQWKIREQTETSLSLFYHSKDGEEHYPGTVSVHTCYSIQNGDLEIEYHATTNKPTPINLTHHSFFNLAGEANASILDHRLHVNADFFTPLDKNQIPTGEIRTVKDTPFDFLQRKRIGEHIDVIDEQIQFGSGYDHNFVLNKEKGKENELSFAARVEEPTTGRTLEVFTTAPGLQFYSANFHTGVDMGKSGVAYQRRSSFCLEPQHFPDAVNQPHFPSIILHPGSVYHQKTLYRFGVL